ncbi:kinesin-like protein KIF26A isoform X1 [Peromyscus maniculatus bairdii]|uniref:kinesin-like protein KIF26A isoform X1 n=2 Tax=Peromyscus maniculatus bairdii TaxID=230844 RepID=UPI001C2EB15B|nr:kinesin-like protein KIF26A isoform X3 [Peromyscus maniculatus bairdii]
MVGRGASLCAVQPAVAECGPAREPQPLEVSPRKRLPAGLDQDPCSSRPAPEGAGASAEQGHSAGGGGWCRHCHTKLVELKRQAWKLVSGPGTPLRDPCLSTLLLDKLPASGVQPACRPDTENRCDVCTTHLHQLTREALRLLQTPASHEDPDASRGGLVAPSPRDPPGPVGLTGRQPPVGPDRRKATAWPAGPSVQVSVAPAGLGGALSTVTIQAQQCLEGVWSLSRVNSFLPPTCLAEAAVAAVAVADTVRDHPPAAGPDGMSKAWGRGAACTTALVTPASGSSAGGSTGPSAAASFFIRAAQKLSLASKRKKHHPPPAPTTRGTSTYPTDFSGTLQLWPPPVPPCLLRAASKAKENPSNFGKVKVMLRIWPAQGVQRSAESTSYLKVDPRKKQVTLYDPAAGPPGCAGLRHAPTAPVPKMFAFDAIFPQDSEQAEVCSGTVADVLQSVVGGADGCIFSFGHMSLGKSYTMIGKDSSPQSLGIVPCAISWLFRLIDERKERMGTRFSIRVSAVEVCGHDQSLRDLLAEVASGSLQDTQSPGVYLREDPVCGAQLQNQNELRAPTAEKAAFYLDAALAARSTSHAGCGGDARRSSHMLFTLHVYQYRVEKCGQGGMSGGRSRLHLIDLGSCEAALSRGGEASGGALCLSLSALGSVILALVNGAKHVPYRDHRLTMLLRESLATTNCRTTMIAHISDSPAHHAETLSTVQLAARIHRLRRKKGKYASSSSGGESSCEESRARRPPHLRPFHPRTVVLDPDRPAPGLPGDPDYSSSSEQSCDTVIYVGPGGAALSDRELTDNEGPPDFVPIIPALSRRRPSEGPRDADHFRCSTFAELQERLECIDGSEGVPGPQGGSDGAQASPARGGRKPSLPEATSPRKAVGPPMVTSSPRGSPGQDTHRSTPEPSKTGTQGDQRVDGTRSEPPAPDKTAGGGGRRPLPSPAPPPPRQPEARGVPTEPGGEGPDGVLRTAPVGMSGQMALSPLLADTSARGRHLERGLLTTTVTLQQPVELNGEDELVFTVVEELPLGGLAGATRPSSLASLGSDCSLQALASGSRPVSIISSINDEFDAYTSSQVSEGPGDPGELPEGTAWPGGSPASSIGSWLSDVGVCLAESRGPTPQPPFSPDSAAGPGPPEFPTPSSFLEDSKFRSSECGRPDNPGSARGLRPGEAVTATQTRPSREPWAGSPHEAASAQTIHSSLPRKPRTTSNTSRAGPSRGPYSPGGLFEDPWLLRAEDCDTHQMASAGGVPSPTPGSPRLPEAQIMLTCAQRVVDGCEMATRGSRRPEAVARIPPLRRGATTLGVTTPAASCGDTPAEAIAHSGSLKTTSSSKKGVSPKGAFLPRPSGAGPPAPPVRKSSLEQNTTLTPTQALGLTRAGATPAFRGEDEARPSGRADYSVSKATSSLKARAGKMEAAHRPTGHMSLERYEGPTHGSGKVREVPGRPPRAVPRLGVPPTSPPLGSAPACRSSPAKGVGASKPPAGGAKGRNLGASTSRTLGTPLKPLAPVAGKTTSGPVPGPRMAPRAAPGLGAKAGRGTIMGTKQAFRAAHTRVHELAASGSYGRGGLSWGSTDSDSGNDSGVNLAEERPPVSPALPSPYSKVTAPRRPQRYSSGHGSDNSSVLSGELPPAMGRTALFYHSGGSSGYESMIRDSEATGSASSAPDSMSESGTASPGARSRSLKSPKKRATGLQRRRLIPAPLPDAAALGRKPSLPGQWVDLPPPLAGSLKEPFEIKVYEIDDVERLQRHRLPLREEEAKPSQDVEKQGPVCISSKLRLAERRQQRLQEVQAKRDHLCEELAETQGRLMVEPGRWLEQFEVDPELEPESAEYLAALEQATAALEQCVNLCKAHVMMVTCFDIGVAATAAVPGPQEVDV